MTQHHTDDKQLRGITLESVLEKRRLDQALNAKEFAVCAGISYSTARCWFHLPDFPAFHGVIFWQDFVQWRSRRNGVFSEAEALQQDQPPPAAGASSRLARIMAEARDL
jgi:hypothetical protein